jgi:hypothetical protein
LAHEFQHSGHLAEPHNNASASASATVSRLRFPRRAADFTRPRLGRVSDALCRMLRTITIRE